MSVGVEVRVYLFTDFLFIYLMEVGEWVLRVRGTGRVWRLQRHLPCGAIPKATVYLVRAWLFSPLHLLPPRRFFPSR